MPLNHAKIRTLRQQAGLTQTQAAAAAGMANKTAWSRLERGDYAAPRLDTLERLARVLGVKVGELVA